jgi:hypothetical protein
MQFAFFGSEMTDSDISVIQIIAAVEVTSAMVALVETGEVVG